MDSDQIAQFCAITNSEVDTATQYLEAANFDLSQAIELFFASGGASVSGQQTAETGVRERIEGTTAQLIDPEELALEEQLRRARRAGRPRKAGVFNQFSDASLEGLSAHERRLATLFRPPFDIIEDIDFDDAKEEAQQLHRWILINIQDNTEFQCQILNRDLWSNSSVKEIIKSNFVFLQYEADSEDGETYRTLYPFESFPHIAVLDPWTGEQQRVWSKVPHPELFVEQLLEYVGTSQNEASADRATPAILRTDESEPATREPSSAPGQATTSTATPAREPSPEPEPASDPVAKIDARDVEEPPVGPDATRIQLRTGGGKRVVRRFLVSAPVADIYAYVKHAFPDLKEFTLTADRKNLAAQLENTIEGANLKNSLVLIDS